MVRRYWKEVVRHLTGSEDGSVGNGNTNRPPQTPSGSENRSGNENDDRSLQPTVEDEFAEPPPSYESTFPSGDRTPPDSVGHRAVTNDSDQYQNSKTEKDVKNTGSYQKESFDENVNIGENGSEESSAGDIAWTIQDGGRSSTINKESAAGDIDWTIQDGRRSFTINKESITFQDGGGNSLIINNNKMEFTRSDGLIVKAHGWTYAKSIKELYSIVWDSPNAYKSTRRRATIFGTSNIGNSIFGMSHTGNSVFGPSNTGNSVFGTTNTGDSVFGSSNTGDSIFAGTNTGNTAYGSTNTGQTLYGSRGNRVRPGSLSFLGYRTCPMNLQDWNLYTAQEQLSASYYWIGDLLWRVFSGEDVSDEDTGTFYNSSGGMQVFRNVGGNIGGQYFVGNQVFSGGQVFSDGNDVFVNGIHTSYYSY